MNITLGLQLGYIIVSKNAYINIDEIQGTYYMILNIKIIALDEYSRLLESISMRVIHNSFDPMSIGDMKFPVSILINENRNYYKIDCKFSELGKTDQIDI